MVLLPAVAIQIGGPPLSPFPYQSGRVARQKQTNSAGFRKAVTKPKLIARQKEHQSRTNHLLVCKWYARVAEMSRGKATGPIAGSARLKGSPKWRRSPM
jgi:hypothetical protein